MPAAQLAAHVCAYLDHVLPAGKARSTDPDKFWPNLIQQPGQIFEIWGQARSNPDRNDLPSSGQNHHFWDQGSAYNRPGSSTWTYSLWHHYCWSSSSGTPFKALVRERLSQESPVLSLNFAVPCIHLVKLWPMDSGSDLTLERKVAGGNSGGETPDESLRQFITVFLNFEYR